MRMLLAFIGIGVLSSVIAETPLRDYAADPDFVAAFRSDAIAMARRKSAALGVSAANARIPVGPRIATGGKFTGHYLWDVAFSVLWAVHTPPGTMPVASTLDNLYRFAESDGYIGREFLPDGTPTWNPKHPVSFNPPMLSWAELALADSPYAVTGRLEKVYQALVRHRKAYSSRFRRPDGLYFGCILGCGMDDMPRWPHSFDRARRAKGGIALTEHSVAERSRGMWKRWLWRHAEDNSWSRQAGWIDMSAAAALDARCLSEIARRIGRADEAVAFRKEYDFLRDVINRKCWDEKTGFYYDVTDDGVILRRHLGALWTMVSGVATKERVARMLETLFDPDVFYRPVPLATLERGDPDYVTERGYFHGPSWPHLNFLAIRGMLDYGFTVEAERLARRWYNCCASLYERTGGIYENMSAEQFDHPKQRTAPDYTGHACLTPVALPALFGWGDFSRPSEVSVAERHVDFTVRSGVHCRMTAEGDALWRLRTSVDGVFAERGAAQALAAWMEEPIRSSPRELRHTVSDGVHSFKASDGSVAVLRLQPFSLEFISAAGKKSVEIDRIDPGRFSSAIGGRLLRKEAVYGLGQRLDRLNKRGQRYDLYASDGYNDSNSTYMSIPLFMTTRGGGVFVNAAERMSADFGATHSDSWLFEIEKGGLEAYVIATDRIMDVPARYHALTGKPRIPEEWNYGPVVCRYSPDLTVLQGPTSVKRGTRRYLGWGVKDILEKYRSMGTLPTAMILEGWSTDIFAGKRKDELKEVCDLLARNGVRSMIWMRCGSVISRNAPGFKKEYEVHVDVTDENGIVKTPNTVQIPDVSLRGGNPDVGSNRAHAVLDITDSDAWNWYVSTVWKGLVDCGVSGAKIDFCEELPDDNYIYGRSRVRYKWKNPSVFAGTSVHHAYPVFFVSKLCRDLSDMLKNHGGFMPFIRGGGLGSQRNPFMWAGDQQRRMDKLDDQILAVLNSGISGVPFMTYDMAGYQYPDMVNEPVAVWNPSVRKLDLSRTAAKTGEEIVYLRRSRTLSERDETQVFALASAFTAYMPCIQTHGFVRNPYDSVGMRDAYCSAVETHRALQSVRAEAARQAVKSGVPIVRPLVMDYQDDENTWEIEDEFLCAGEFLVAPLLSAEGNREVYLPEGKWRDVSTGELHDVPKYGLRIKKKIDIGGIAVYQKIIR